MGTRKRALMLPFLMLLVLIAMALGWGVWLLCTADVGAPVFALPFFWRFRVYV
jgi:hypothetical protein